MIPDLPVTENKTSPYPLSLHPREIALFLSIIALYLTVQSLLNEYLLENVFNSESGDLLLAFLDLFSVNAEETIPTWYATLLLFAASVLLFFIAAIKRRNKEAYAYHWLGLGFIFLYLSMDEGAVIHEIFSDALQARFDTSGYLTFAWIIVFVPLVIVIALLYLRFLWHLPPSIRNLFIVAGLLYVGGAVVVEAISANLYDSGGGVTFPYLAIATVEETMEMLGVVVFIFALLSYAALEQITAVLAFPPQPAAAVSTPTYTKWIIGTAVVLILTANVMIVSWAKTQQTEPVAIDPRSIPFYRTVSEEYDGQGVIILGVSELIQAENPAAVPIATSLITLFDDVMVVSLPTANISIAFASPSLPFDQETLAEIVRESGEEEFVILETTAVRKIVENTGPQP
jgi:hypothetical protein